MPESHGIVKSEPSITSIQGLKKEVSTSVVRYFAPLVAMAREFSATAGIATTWWRSKELDKNQDTDRPSSKR